MDSKLEFGLAGDIFKGVQFHSSKEDTTDDACYKTVLPVYEYLAACQREDGAIFDRFVSSTLDPQYHHTSFGLASTILFIINSEPRYYENAYKAFKYYIDIPLHKKKGGVDFSNYPILLASILLGGGRRDCRLTSLLSDYIDSMVHHSNLEPGSTYGNNFVALRALNQLLRYRVLGKEDDLKEARHYMDCTLKWQFDDGIFYDYPRRPGDRDGVPSLAYHSKITLMTLMFGIVSADTEVISRAVAGLEAMESLIAPDGEAYYYGRTNNALYGYACGILAARTASSLTGVDAPAAKRFSACEKALVAHVNRHRAQDGHLYIVPNGDEAGRCGFDNYMFVSVYNAFTMASLLLSSLIHADAPSDQETASASSKHFRDSGFFIKKGHGLSMALNLKGHNSYEQYLLDPRFTCLTPLFIKFRGHDMLPTIPLTSPVGTGHVGESFLSKAVRKAGEVMSEFNSWSFLDHYNPLYSGFMPCVIEKNSLLMPLRADQVSVIQEGKTVRVRAKGRLSAIRCKGLKPLLLFLLSSAPRLTGVTPEGSRKALISVSDACFEREIIIGESFIRFIDRFTGVKAGSPFFTIRTYSEGNSGVSDSMFTFKSGDYGFSLLLEEGESVKMSRILGSSKGKAAFWTVERSLPGRREGSVTEMDHTLLFFEQSLSLEESLSRYKSAESSLHFNSKN